MEKKSWYELMDEQETIMFARIHGDKDLIPKVQRENQIKIGSPSLKSLVGSYNPDIDLGSKGSTLGHNLASSVDKVYTPRVIVAHGNPVKENDIRIELREMDRLYKNSRNEPASPEVRDYYLNKMIKEAEKKINDDFR